jgi:alpha-L-fucosidase
MPAISKTIRIRRVLATLFFVFPMLPMAGAIGQESPSPMRPTASLSPAELDAEWEKGSAKYATRRAQLLQDVEKEVSKGPYRADWESLKSYQIPDWYKDAKFGIFIHWGVYSVPAYGSEWYPREMYREGSDIYKHHLATYGPPSKFGYKDFIPMFKAERFDPKTWARLFKESGAKYVVPVFEHHDGFAMYDSGLSDWTAAKMGPSRDLVGELAEAIRAEGLRLGASSHRIEHNFFLDGGRKIDSDVNDPQYAAFYGPAHAWLEGKQTLLEDWTYLSNAYLNDWLARDAEIVEKYNPDLVYFDWWIGQPEARRHVEQFAAFYYNHQASWGKIGVINYKSSAMEKESAVLDVERGQLSAIRPLYWQTDTSISNKSWGYIQNDSFKSPEAVVHQLIDIVSKNGNLLVNIGPRSDGTIPEEVQSVLREIGGWLQINGEAIYGTRAWTIFGEGPTLVVEGPFHDSDAKPFTAQDFRFTRKGNELYAIEMGWPDKGEAIIHTLNEALLGRQKISSLKLLGDNSTLAYEVGADGLHIHLPSQAPGKYAYAFQIEVTGPLPVGPSSDQH